MGSAGQEPPQLWWQLLCPQGRRGAEQSPPAQAPLGHQEGSCWGSPPQRGWAGPDPTPPAAPGRDTATIVPSGTLFPACCWLCPAKPRPSVTGAAARVTDRGQSASDVPKSQTRGKRPWCCPGAGGDTPGAAPVQPRPQRRQTGRGGDVRAPWGKSPESKGFLCQTPTRAPTRASHTHTCTHTHTHVYTQCSALG